MLGSEDSLFPCSFLPAKDRQTLDTFLPSRYNSDERKGPRNIDCQASAHDPRALRHEVCLAVRQTSGSSKLAKDDVEVYDGESL